MKKIYVCSMFVGDEIENGFQAQKCAEYVALTCNAIPVSPQVYWPSFLYGRNFEANFIREANMELLRCCDELWYFGDGVTKEMVDMILAARELNIPVKHVADRDN